MNAIPITSNTMVARVDGVDWKTGHLNESDSDGDDDVNDEMTPVDANQVLQAAEYGDNELLRKFLQHNPDLINCTDCDGYTPLHRASYNGHVETICLLLDKGANLHAKSSDGWQPIHSACRWSHVRAAALLVVLLSIKHLSKKVLEQVKLKASEYS